MLDFEVSAGILSDVAVEEGGGNSFAELTIVGRIESSHGVVLCIL